MINYFKKRRKKKMNTKGLFSVLICVFALCITIAYASMNSELNISGEAIFRTEADIRIIKCELISSAEGSKEEYSVQYSVNTIISGIELPELDSNIVYEITVTNFVNINMTLNSLEEINYTNSNIEYYLEGFDIGDEVNGLSTVTIKLGFKYKDGLSDLPANKKLESQIKFNFTKPDTTPPVLVDLKIEKKVFITDVNNINFLDYVSAIDDLDKNVANKITYTINKSELSEPGNYEIIYNVKDKSGNEAKPLKITLLVWNFTKIVSGQYFGIALGTEGSVWTWGYNNVGQRGLGNTTSASNFRAPTQIPQTYFNNEPVIDIAAGYASGHVVTDSGKAYSWGDGTAYQLGNNSTSNQSRPVLVSKPDDIKFIKISSFYQTVAALGDDGNVYTWGYSVYGANGSGSTSNKSIPSAITAHGNFVDISQGFNGGAAVNSNGEVYVWGTNVEGQSGVGSTGGSSKPPTKVPNLNNINSISYGFNHILALTDTGEVYAWGGNGSGRLGLGDTTTKSTPTKIPNLNNVSQVNTGYDFSQFKVENNIYSSGFANYGELFAGNTTSRSTPYLSTMNNISENVGYIAGKFDNAFILSKDGAVVYGIGYCDPTGQEFGSTVTQITSTGAAIPWSFTSKSKESIK